MAGRSKTVILFVCAVISAACASDSSREPTSPVYQPATQPQPEPEVIETFMLLPHSLSLPEGAETGLALVIRNQRGYPPAVRPVISYSTSSPSTVNLGPTGLLTAVGPGRAVIIASATFGQVTLVDSSVVTVSAATVYDGLVLTAEAGGWTPTPAHVYAGGKVEWVAGVITGSGLVSSKVYLWRGDEIYSFEEIDLSSGSANRTLTSPGMYHYCSGGCWEPPEYGTIVVH